MLSVRRLTDRRRAPGAATVEERPPSPGEPGVNVVGYLDRTSGLAERARVLLDVLEAAGVPCSRWPVATTASPVTTAVAPAGDAAAAAPPTVRSTSIAVVTALEFPGLQRTHAEVLAASRVVGYWFWEVEAIPPSHQAAIDLVDEIWAPTAFVRDAYRSVTATPVHLVPLPIPEPQAAEVSRADVGLDERFTFLVSFDHLSVMERKHPLGAIEAFVRAFPAGDEPVRLLVKSLNASARPRRHATLLAAAARDPRITVHDAHTPADVHMALIAHADCYVSLHRSEGLGLQPAAAMWLGTPVIASRYSGTLDLMDDASAELIDVTMIPARNTEGAYPPEAVWADPDLDQAAAAMRRLVGDPQRCTELATAARARRERDDDVAAAGRRITELLARPAMPRQARAPLASVAPMSAPAADPAGPDAPAAPAAAPPAGAPRTDVKRVARAATAPVRNYLNNHFEMVKHEVRTHTGDSVHIANLIHELEATVAEASVHQARTIARLREESAALSDRIAELERVVERLTAVVAASLGQHDDRA